MHPRHLLVSALLLSAAPAVPLGAQLRDPDAFRQDTPLAAGRTVHVHNVNGSVTVSRGSGDRVEVGAKKQVRRGDPGSVRIVQRTAANGDLVVCALWYEAECTDDGIRGGRTRRNNRDEVTVAFAVRVPDGVHVALHTVNGGVVADGVTGMVDAETVNGSITVRTTGGPVRAETVNGSIRATMGALGRDDLRYETVNGSITLELPADASAEVALATVNGSVSTGLPVTVQGRVSRKALRGTIGRGGPLVKAETVNGSITVRPAG
ncbi:MAG: hypothetical protein RLZ32_2256 [Gemmatimonadota bacterium]|jgi:hypothetical protein